VLEPIEKKSLADAVFEQLRDRIVTGQMEPGSKLPAERALSEQLGVNRGAVREALKRLEQARLISIRQGGSTRVLDFRQTAGTDLLAALLVTSEGGIDTRVARSVMEMRSALAADIARLCARRGGQEIDARLAELVEKMEESARDLPALQQLALEFWSTLVDGSDNVAYRLSINSLVETYKKIQGLLLGPLADELGDLDAYTAIADAVARGDEEDAEFYARDLVRLGERRITELMNALEEAGDEERNR
jgi:GntR family transcriptional regulator, transcriptional repressor for pyruvate dehydrogenase complex